MVPGLTAMGAALLVVAVSTPPAGAASPPLPTKEHAEDDVFLYSCGSFDLRDHVVFDTQGKIFVDEQGNPTRIVQHVGGSDTIYNSVTGESVTGTINSGEIVDLVKGTATQSGTVGRITLPGMGVVFFDVGRFTIDFETGLVFLAGHQHDFLEGDFAQLCDVLG